jgi:peptidoglycan/xylan/chitin deacetylase (PgdA/CDA1 family)
MKYRERCQYMKHNVCIVVYHDISSEKNPLTSQLSISTRPDVFRKHVLYFVKNFDVIGVDELLSDRLPPRPLLVTFDDAYQSVLSIAGPILKEVGIPSVFSVIASAVRGDSLPIDNVLSLAVEEIGLPRVLDLSGLTATAVSSVGEVISRYVASMRPAEITGLKTRLLSAIGTTEAEARQMSKTFLDLTDMHKLEDFRIEVGNHSLTHSFFRALSREELEVEIGQSRQVLQRLSGQQVRCLSIPYGDRRDATESVLAIAHASGHVAIFLVHARSNRFRRHDNTYYRVALSNERLPMMPLLLWVFPILRSLRRGLS